jgi:hypothetical protein
MKVTRAKRGDNEWNTNYKCSKIEIDGVDQGEASIYAKQIENPQGDDVNSMLFTFTNAPKDLMRKIGNDNGGNKWRVPFRLIGDLKYFNPWVGSKYIFGSIFDEQGNSYNFRIFLPHKTLGWYINDEEGNKLANLITKMATDRRGKVKNAKQTISKNYQNYVDSKTGYENLSKGVESYNAWVKERQNSFNSLRSDRETLQSKATEAENKLNLAKKELIEAENTLNDLMIQLSNVANQKQSIENSITEMATQGSDLAKNKASLTTVVESNKTTLNNEYTKLLNYAPERTAAINASKTALFNNDKVSAKSNLDKVIPK